MGRPVEYIVDEEKVELAASFGNTYEEISTLLDVPAELLRKSYSHYYRKGRDAMVDRLRKAQVNAAMSGNPTMLIWLGKQYMGQADKSEVLRKSESIQSIDISALKPDQLVELVQAIDKIKAMMAQPAEVLSIENVERLRPIVESEPSNEPSNTKA